VTQKQLRLVFRVLLFLLKAERRKVEAKALESELKDQLELLIAKVPG
jgi:hypothetical protein